MPRKEEIGATRDSFVYQLRVPKPLKAQWDEYCAQSRKKPSSLIRAIMRYLIQDEMPPEVREWISTQAEGKADNSSKKRIEVRLTQSEYEAVILRAEAEGCSTQRWVINCVRASLTNEPQFTMETTKALWDSSYQLRAIGKNLNQIAKRLNEGGKVEVSAAAIEKLTSIISAHTNKAAALLDASLGRWKINHD
jgi:hypothetical protein